jgi:hypothetical protein
MPELSLWLECIDLMIISLSMTFSGSGSLSKSSCRYSLDPPEFLSYLLSIFFKEPSTKPPLMMLGLDFMIEILASLALDMV